MATVVSCDRCGSVIEPSEFGMGLDGVKGVEIRLRSFHATPEPLKDHYGHVFMGSHDLCLDCLRHLDNFFGVTPERYREATGHWRTAYYGQRDREDDLDNG